MTTSTAQRRNRAWSLRGAMMADHADIATLFDDTLAAFRSGNRDEATAMFADFERRLEAHLAVEDDVLLPTLRRDHPDEAEALAADHARIRGRLAELAVGVDLHLTRADWIAELIDLLKAHAAREDALLYRWAGEPGAHIDPERVLHRLAAI
jgi:hypothetical protein